MRRYRLVNKDRFIRFIKMLMLLGAILFTVLFVKFMDAHNGLGPRTVEYHTYEITRQTSSENPRIKVPVAREVVYRYVYQ